MYSVSATGNANMAATAVIEVHVAELNQLFNSMDPSPFRDRDLDPDAEEYIVGSGRELPRDAPLELCVHLDRAEESPHAAAILRDAVHRFFVERSKVERLRLKQLFRIGRISLLIGLAFLGASLGASQLIESYLHPGGFMRVVRESLLIGGWVAMWRPIEVFLYDWWPMRAEAHLFDRLAAMSVAIRYTRDETPGVRPQPD